MAKKKSKKKRIDLSHKRYTHHHWDFPPILPKQPKDMGLPDDWEDNPGDFDKESQCGPNDESQPVEQYDGTLGVTQAFVKTRQSRVGQLQWNDNLDTIYTNPGDFSGLRWCTGTLISCNLFLTAGHCLDQMTGVPLVNGTTNFISNEEIATNMHINFNWQVDPNGVMRTEQQFAVVELVEYREGPDNLDYAILRLEGNPGGKFGWTKISTTDAEEDEMLCIIQHPAGLPKRIEAGPTFHLHGTRIGYDSIDTQRGSSGSGILRSPDGQIVGVHTNGGCDATQSGHNHGVRITSIRAVSPTIRNLDRPIFKFSADRCINVVGPVKLPDITLKFLDAHDGNGIKNIIDGGGIKNIIDGGGIKKIRDGEGTLKPFDDLKGSGLDKQFSDVIIPGRGVIDPAIRGGFTSRTTPGATPFVLATPHHSMAWTRQYYGVPASPPAEQSDAGATLQQYETTLLGLEQTLQHKSAEIEAITNLYQQLINEYKALAEAHNQGGQ